MKSLATLALALISLLASGWARGDLPPDEINKKYNSANIFPREVATPSAAAIQKKRYQLKSGALKYPRIDMTLTPKQVSDQIKERHIENNKKLQSPQTYFMERNSEVIFMDQATMKRLRGRFPNLRTNDSGEISSIEFDDIKYFDVARRSAAPRPQSAPLPASWRISKKYIQNNARDQMQCGSCATFAGVAIMEAKRAMRNRSDVDNYNISEQMILNCSSNTCEGGYTNSVLDYAIWADSWGDPLPNETREPYRGRVGACNESRPRRYWANSYGSVATDRETLKRSLRLYGPLAISIRTNDDFDDYWGAETVLSLPSDQPYSNHVIELLGWSNAMNAWLVRNSWGNEWGKNGIGWIAYSSKIYNAHWVTMHYPGD
jgi:hypothetical protein